MSVSSLTQTPPEVDSTTLADTVYSAIFDKILRGQLVPGTALSAVRWSETLGVSRSPVHDALRRLAADGLVEIHTGRRAQVARFTADDLWEIFEMRRLLESHAAELAAGRADRRHITPLRDQANHLTDTPVTDPAWIDLWSAFDEDFHATVATCSGNARLAADIGRYRLIHRGFNRARTTAEDLPAALAEHIEILDALENRDPQSARTAMENHIAHWQTYFVNNFEPEPAPKTRAKAQAM